METVGSVAGGGDPGPETRWLLRAERFTDAFGLLLVLLLLTCGMTSLMPDSGWSAVLLLVAFGATSVVALGSSHASGAQVLSGAALAGIALLLGLIAAVGGADLWLDIAGAITVVLLLASTVAVLLRVLVADRVETRTLLGAICVYILIGILFSALYDTLDRIEGGGFFAGHPAAVHGDFLFFSVTTLTTTGYGDLVPAGQPGQLIAGLEMVIGPAFLVTLVARLVTLWRPGESLLRRRERLAVRQPDR